MSRLPRPYIPIQIRIKVAERQFDASRHNGRKVYNLLKRDWSLKRRLQWLLLILGFEHPECDHDPALILRKFNSRTRKFSPDANNPKFLIYCEKAEHQQKTTGRKPGATRTITTKGSDIGLKAKFARLERQRPPKPKHRIPAPIKPRWPKRAFTKK